MQRERTSSGNLNAWQRRVKGALGVVLLIVWSGLPAANGQGTFGNLNFEQATIVLDSASPYYPFAAIASNALPRWVAYQYGSAANSIFYNSFSLGSAAVSIHDTNDTFGLLPIAGNYSVFLQGQSGIATSTNDTAALAQSGQIPATARSLRFLGSAVGLQVTFNGSLIPFSGIGPSGSWFQFGDDISALAGQSGELRFTAPLNGSSFLDNIQFSDQPVPEPSAFGLLLGWLVGLGLKKRGWRFV